MSFGSLYAHSVPGLSGRYLLNPATTATIGFGSTPATFSIVVPANASLAGLQLTAQGLLAFPGAVTTTLPVMISVR